MPLCVAETRHLVSLLLVYPQANVGELYIGIVELRPLVEELEEELVRCLGATLICEDNGHLVFGYGGQVEGGFIESQVELRLRQVFRDVRS